MRRGRRLFKNRRKRLNLAVIREAIVWFLEIVLVCLLAVFLVWYFGRKVSNIGDSMQPMMDNGDVVLVNQVVYNISQPKRFDVIVFKPNGNENEQYYIRRIIGLPGETVQISDGKIRIDGEELEEQDLNVSELENAGIAEEPVTVGGDEYFVLGDNRLELSDSRDADIGNVNKDDIYGKAWLIWSPRKHFGLIRYK